jgi:hypothetical protein
MANGITRRVEKLRFLIVGAIVMALLSSPILSNASLDQKSEVLISDLNNTIAGMPVDFMAYGDPYEPIDVALTKPSGSSLSLQVVTDAKGEAFIELYDYHVREAGEYTVAARHLNGNGSYSAASSFVVYTGPVDLGSQVSLNKKTAQTGETLELKVELADSYGNPIDGHVLKVISSDSKVSIYTPEFATDESGEMSFYLTSDEAVLADLSIYDSSINKTLNSTPQLAFTGDSNSFQAVGGWSYDSSNIVLASDDAGPIDSFRIEGIEESTVAAEQLSVTITAIDEDGLTVTDYTGTVRFSSSDEAASLPNDYEFSAEDQGQHAFSLAFEFITQGEQSLTVTDIDQPSIEGEFEFEVVDEDADYDSDYVTTSYEREGDFTLISPASGTYSSDNMEVQGEAEYGYSAVIYLNDDIAGYTDVDFDDSFTYSLQGLNDGDYELYVEIASVSGEDDNGDPLIDELIETSEVETLTIDTSAPELVSIESDPESSVGTGDSFVITVLSEASLEEASVILDEEVYELEETSTSGKYQVNLVAPDEEGEFTIDVVLMDQLGNQVQYRDQLSITVSANAESNDTETDDAEIADGDGDDDDVSDAAALAVIPGATGLTALSGEESVTLSWEAVDSENPIAYYRVYYGPSSDSMYAISDTFDSSTSWVITNLTGDEVYYFSVAAVDIEGEEGEQSDAVLGVPTAKAENDSSETIPDTSDDPEISSTEMPEETPETGPASAAMLLLSTLGSGAYMTARRRR